MRVSFGKTILVKTNSGLEAENLRNEINKSKSLHTLQPPKVNPRQNKEFLVMPKREELEATVLGNILSANLANQSKDSGKVLPRVYELYKSKAEPLDVSDIKFDSYSQ